MNRRIVRLGSSWYKVKLPCGRFFVVRGPGSVTVERVPVSDKAMAAVEAAGRRANRKGGTHP